MREFYKAEKVDNSRAAFINKLQCSGSKLLFFKPLALYGVAYFQNIRISWSLRHYKKPEVCI